MLHRHLTAVVLTAVLVGLAGTSVCTGKEPVKVHDRLWAWGHYEGIYNGQFQLPGTSRITPIEGAAYLGVSNLIFVRYTGKPEYPWDQYAIPFRAMHRVMWSATGASGHTSAEERQHVLELAGKNPNITGLFLDDFFQNRPANAATGEKPGLKAVMSLDEMRQLRQQLLIPSQCVRIVPRRLELGVTLYTNQLDPAISPYLELCDLVSVWTWKAADLLKLEENMQRFWKMSPRSRTLLGLYMWDFGAGKPMPVAAMQHQCDLGLKWLREGRVEGLILLGTNVCDLNLEAVEWARAWIARVGNEPLNLPAR